MATVRRLIIVHTPLPDGPTQARWKCEAIRLGFATRGTVLKLCFQRYYWRCVQRLEPTRDVGRGGE